MGILNVGKVLASIGLKLQAITGGTGNYPAGEEGLIIYDKDENKLKIFTHSGFLMCVVKQMK
mgnify:CR=1 FL=1